MARSSVIGALRVNLGLDSAQFTRGTKQAQTSMQKLSGYMKVAGVAIAGALVGAAAGMAKLGIDSIKTADEISKAAQAIGIGTEELSRLRYAADLSGVSFEQLQTGVGRLSRNMLDASRGLAAPARAFDQLGISVQNSDGTLRTSTAVIGDISDRFSKMEDGAEKTALAMEVFGRAGADLIPMLNSGREGIEALTAEADKFGIVIDAETGRKAEAFNDNLARLQGAFGAAATKISAEMLPALVDLTDWLVANTDAIRSFSGEISKSLQGIGFMITKIIQAAGALRDFFAPALDLAARGLRALGIMGNATGGNSTRDVFDALKNAARSTAPAINAATTSLGQFTGAVAKGGGRAGRTVVAQVRDEAKEAETALARLRSAFTSVQNQLDPALASQRRRGEQQGAITDAVRAGITSNAEAGRLLGLQMKVAEGIETIEVGTIELAAKSKTQTQIIADNFAQMSQRVVSSLQGLSNSIRSGDFLGILGGVLNTVVQLGSIGAFGKGFAGRVNSAPNVPAFANGTNFAPGGMALVGERGPELVNLPRGSQVIPNHKMGGATHVTVGIDPRNGNITAFVDGQIAQTAPLIAQGGAAIAQAQSSQRARRSVRR